MIAKEPTLTSGLHTHVHMYAHTNKDMPSTHTGKVGRREGGGEIVKDCSQPG